MKLEIVAGVRQGAFFDLERTITADAVEQVASLAMWRRRDISPPRVLRVLWCYLHYLLPAPGAGHDPSAAAPRPAQPAPRVW